MADQPNLQPMAQNQHLAPNLPAPQPNPAAAPLNQPAAAAAEDPLLATLAVLRAEVAELRQNQTVLVEDGRKHKFEMAAVTLDHHNLKLAQAARDQVSAAVLADKALVGDALRYSSYGAVAAGILAVAKRLQGAPLESLEVLDGGLQRIIDDARKLQRETDAAVGACNIAAECSNLKGYAKDKAYEVLKGCINKSKYADCDLYSSGDAAVMKATAKAMDAVAKKEQEGKKEAASSDKNNKNRGGGRSRFPPQDRDTIPGAGGADRSYPSYPGAQDAREHRVAPYPAEQGGKRGR